MKTLIKATWYLASVTRVFNPYQTICLTVASPAYVSFG